MGRGQQRTPDEQRSAPDPVGQAAGEGSQEEGGDGEGPERQPGSRGVGAHRSDDVGRQGVDGDAGRGEVREVPDG